MTSQQECQNKAASMSSFFRTLCIYDSNLEDLLITASCIICILSLMLCIYLCRKANQKIRKMTTPQPNPTYAETYCILSVYQLQMVKVTLTLVGIKRCFFTFKALLGRHYT